MFLAVYYAPAPDYAYDSFQINEEQVTFGAFVRGLHHWVASGMVVAVGPDLSFVGDTRPE